MSTLLIVSLIAGFTVFSLGAGLVARGNVRWIVSPRFGILDFSDGTAAALIEEDTNALRDILGVPDESASRVPLCDVLFIYGKLDGSGAFEGRDLGLREIIRDSGATVAVVASENASESYIKAAPRKPYGDANLVMTLSRRGVKFPDFFRSLFSRMNAGTPMPIAWVALAPQIPNHEHSTCPDTIFACEVGQVAFK
jgi:hypothetical protein